MGDVAARQVEAADDPGAREVQGGDGSRPGGVRPQQQGGQYLGPDRALRAPLRPADGVVLLGDAAAQVDDAALGKGIPDGAFRRRQIVVLQHLGRLSGPPCPKPAEAVSKTVHGGHNL